MHKVVTLGEILLRLSPDGKNRIVNSCDFEVAFGGAEANVSLSLAGFNIPTIFLSKVPTNIIGEMAINHLAKYGVDTSYVKRSDQRLGLYYLEKGISMRPYKVIYDREHSAMASASVDDFDFDQIYQEVTWLHISGITPALSDSTRELTKIAIVEAKKRGIIISFDINYRSNLWSEKKAFQTLASYLKDVDIFIGGNNDVKNLLLAKYDDNPSMINKIEVMDTKQRYNLFFDKFSMKYMASTIRKQFSASDNGWSALLYDGNQYYYSKNYQIRICDRVGGGDSFAAGLIYGLLTNNDNKYIINFASAASALKHTIYGDGNLTTVEEVHKLMGGDSSGRVER